MTYYPLFLSLAGKEVLVVGAGSVGRRKIAALLHAAPARITVVDPGLDEAAIRELEESGPVRCFARPFAPQDIDNAFLVFAAAGRREVNAQVTALCAGRNILCNCADAPQEGNTIVPAHITCDGISIALSTQGQSPALARRLREELEAWVGKRYTPLLLVLGRLRPLLLELGLPSEENARLFRALVRSPLTEHLETGNTAAALALLADLLPEPLQSRVGELVHGR